jgi:hypothetical protein
MCNDRTADVASFSEASNSIAPIKNNDLHLQDSLTEKEGISVSDSNSQLWHMRWFFAFLLAFWLAGSIAGPIIVFCITKSQLSLVLLTNIAPPVKYGKKVGKNPV